jgi:isoleucyl-tRNA synthetase
MSKSLGNGVEPVEITEKLGGEIVRLWVASVDFRNDVACSDNLMQRVAENYRKLRNSLFRYVLGNLRDFDPAQDSVPFAEMHALDRYMLRQTAAVSEEIKGWYDEFAFHKIYQRIMQFCVVDLSAMYFDVLKDRLYTSAPKSQQRRSAQTAIWKIGEALTRLLAPIMTFTCDEVWQYLPPVAGRPESVHLAAFPTNADLVATDASLTDDKTEQEDWATLLQVRNEVLKALETERANKVIGGGLEAQVKLTAADPVYSVLQRYAGELRYLFIVSAVVLEKAATNGSGPVGIQVSKAEGKKCDRCWNFSTHVGEDAKHPTVCERCSAVLKEMNV